jgi:hypothetical protein
MKASRLIISDWFVLFGIGAAIAAVFVLFNQINSSAYTRWMGSNPHDGVAQSPTPAGAAAPASAIPAATPAGPTPSGPSAGASASHQAASPATPATPSSAPGAVASPDA